MLFIIITQTNFPEKRSSQPQKKKEEKEKETDSKAGIETDETINHLSLFLIFVMSLTFNTLTNYNR